MKATCALCAQTFEVEKPYFGPLRETAPEAWAAHQLSEFDLLAGKLVSHIGTAHRIQTGEMSAIMHLAAKAYAMSWTHQQGIEFEAMRESWRTAVMAAISDPQAVYAAEAAAAAAGTEAEADSGDGSNSKKSARKDSN